MAILPLISVGIPTYKRPDGLEKTLQIVTSQTYKNLEIIISDNCSQSDEVKFVIQKFREIDSRIIAYEQQVNIGPVLNFKFLLDKAVGDFFIWAADDDQWQSEEFLSLLLEYAPRNLLTFPEAVIYDKETNSKKELLSSYSHCKSPLDYSRNFIVCGWGYPVYGLYNLRLFTEYGLSFEFDKDLLYYNEGTFLHQVFLAGPVKFVKEAKILFSTDSNKPSWDVRIDNFVHYFKRTIGVYAAAGLAPDQKSQLIDLVIKVYLSYMASLLKNLVPGIIISTNSSMKSPNSVQKIAQRLKLAAKILINGK